MQHVQGNIPSAVPPLELITRIDGSCSTEFGLHAYAMVRVTSRDTAWCCLSEWIGDAKVQTRSGDYL